MNKKILFVNSSLTAGGSERVMTLLANEFASKGYDVTMVLLRELSPDSYVLNSQVKCIRFQYGTKNKLVIAIKRYFMLRKLLKHSQFCAVISFMYDINVMTLLAAWGLKQTVIVSERGDPNARKSSELYKKIEHSLYLHAKKIVFQTEQVKEIYPYDIKEKSVVIPNPISDSLPERYSDEREKRVVAVGRMTAQKNFSMLIKAFAKFYLKNPEYKLTIYGAGQLMESLKEEAKACEVAEVVEFPGYVSDVNEQMNKAMMYISSSNYEGISNAMLEALGMGLPSICTDCPVGGAAMMIEDGVNGILIPVGDENALYESMLRVANDREFAEKLSLNALKIKEEYSLDRVVKQWEMLLE